MQQMMPPALVQLRATIQESYFGPTRSISASAHVPSLVYRYKLMRDVGEIARSIGFRQYLCEENFFDLWFGPQDEHAGFRYAIHYDFWQERQRLGHPLTTDDALNVARRFSHTPS
jgi:hypothetical protein